MGQQPFLMVVEARRRRRKWRGGRRCLRRVIESDIGMAVDGAELRGLPSPIPASSLIRSDRECRRIAPRPFPRGTPPVRPSRAAAVRAPAPVLVESRCRLGWRRRRWRGEDGRRRWLDLLNRPWRRWRRRRFGGAFRGLARIVIGDNAPNGGENLLHRRFLRSRRLVHTRPHLRSQRAIAVSFPFRRPNGESREHNYAMVAASMS